MPQLFHHTADYIRTSVCFLYAKIVHENFRRSISQKLEPIRKKLSTYLGSATSIYPKIDLAFSAKIFFDQYYITNRAFFSSAYHVLPQPF